MVAPEQVVVYGLLGSAFVPQKSPLSLAQGRNPFPGTNRREPIMDRILIVGLFAATGVLLVWAAVKALEVIGKGVSPPQRFRPGKERATITGGQYIYPVCVYDPCIGVACSLGDAANSPATVKIGTVQGSA